MIPAVVDDLIFRSKIHQTANSLGIRVLAVEPEGVESQVKGLPARAVVFDLEHPSGSVITVIRALKTDPALRKVKLVGFLSHVQADLAAAAREAGCDVLLARLAFSKQVPQLLQQQSNGDTPHRGRAKATWS